MRRRPWIWARAASPSSTCRITMYPPSPPRFSSSRPAVVPSAFGATTSRKVSPIGKTAFFSPNLPTPGSAQA
ncbi:hypothetical protein [Phenylobacterium sp. J367]|uniref:hypothetical protein n=1 Tax=Phenylobacterium sp. J367 TaxID=2898435 RepID=UPI00215158EA|nr:hypothetical protein [Phenylobacterium sp. J367]MCR5877491.1 hypothetical protein [Phenylobacterium sp. J367]